MSDNSGESIREKADAAFRQASAKVIERARLHGTRIIVWEDGRVVERTWDEMERELAKKREEVTPASILKRAPRSEPRRFRRHSEIRIRPGQEPEPPRPKPAWRPHGSIRPRQHPRRHSNPGRATTR